MKSETVHLKFGSLSLRIEAHWLNDRNKKTESHEQSLMHDFLGRLRYVFSVDQNALFIDDEQLIHRHDRREVGRQNLENEFRRWN
jgi:hypothetical protein